MDIPQDEADATIRLVSLRLGSLVGAMFFVNFLDRVAVSFAGPSGMNRDLGIGPEQFGFAVSIFFLGYLAFEIPSNLALHRFGARRWLARIMISWGVVTALFAWVSGPYGLYLLRLLLGAAEAGFFPGAILFLSLWVPAAYRSRVLGSFYVAQPVTLMVGGPLAAWLIELGGAAGFTGWRAMYVGVGALAVLVGVVTWRFLPDRPAEARWLTEAQRGWLTGAIEREGGARVAHASVREALSSGRVWLLALTYFGIVYGLYALAFFLPTIVAEFERGTGAHLGAMRRGLITAVPYVPAVIVLVLWSRDASRRGIRAWHVGVPMLAGAVAVSTALVLPSPAAVLAAVAVVACGVFAALPTFWSLPTRFLSGIALINTVGNLSGLGGPFLTGWLRHVTGSYEVPMCVVGGFMALSALLVLGPAGRMPRR